MRDGVNLSTDIILPKDRKGPLATILIRTPYDKEGLEMLSGPAWYQSFLDAGYALVVQNERGRLLSEGTYSSYLAGAATDGYDTVQWRSEEHTSELQSLMRISYAVFFL